MLELGVAGATIDLVRAAAGVSSSQIYHYFGSKEELLRAVLESQNDEIVSVHEAIFANLDTLEGLRAWRDFILDHQRRVHCRGGCPIGTLGSEIAEIDPIARAISAEGFRRWETAIRRGYRAMQARGSLLPSVDVEALALATLASLQGGLMLTQIERRIAPLQAALDATLAHVASLCA
ncbi:MAG: transcriptional regulator, TetR family [Ilumatobacteraceae bacterium]|nr:transcriptional regulator, TetR family [Ilumatobacteraceae bacterium]